MTTYTLRIHIGSNQLPFLQNPEAPHTLCIARKVNEEYNIVWKGFEDFSENTFIRWVNGNYLVFASSAFKNGALVKATSNSQSIQFKQQCKLNEFGVMEAAVDDPNAEDGTFELINNYREQEAVNFGVGVKANKESSIIYNTPMAVESGTTLTLTPHDEVRVWFSLNDKMSTMVLNDEREYIDVSFMDGRTTAEISYEGEEPGRATWWLIY
ncbi:hypothetical protein GYMLUDRAFT_47003, partial [Collybiopsis luxurians FD-317 M1]